MSNAVYTYMMKMTLAPFESRLEDRSTHLDARLDEIPAIESSTTLRYVHVQFVVSVPVQPTSRLSLSRHRILHLTSR